MPATPAQQAAIETTARELLLSSGAGSGKTFVLAERVRYLIERRGLSPHELLVLTFTRRAARELVSRIVGTDGDADHWRGCLIGTFHAVALKILHADGAWLGYKPDRLTIAEPADADLMLKWVCKDLGHIAADLRVWRHGLSFKTVNAAREQMYTTGNLDGLDEKLQTIVREYHARMRRLNTLDFGMMLMEVHRLFREQPEVLGRYQRRIKAVLVDELQDSDEVQFCLHDWFAPPATFFGVGDRRQSIYGFRGARPDLMTERHPEATIIDLVDCFRCGSAIVASANRLIAHNRDPRAKPMRSATNTIGGVTFTSGGLVPIIDAARDVGFAPKDIAILARRHATLRDIEAELNAAGVPCHRVGAAFDVTETDGFRGLHAALRLLVNPGDDMAFARLSIAVGIGSAEFADTYRRALQLERTMFHATDEQKLMPLRNLTAERAGSDWDDSIGVIVERVAAALSTVWKYDYETEALKLWAGPDYAGKTLPEALEWFALRELHDDLPEQQTGIELLTCHAAKGLEFPCVIIASCEEGELPSRQSTKEDGGVEEERRLMYVACTRAKECLIVQWRLNATGRGGVTWHPWPSRFVEECQLKP